MVPSEGSIHNTPDPARALRKKMSPPGRKEHLRDWQKKLFKLNSFFELKHSFINNSTSCSSPKSRFMKISSVKYKR
jgi:hypothetical protein